MSTFTVITAIGEHNNAIGYNDNDTNSFVLPLEM